MKIRRTMRRNGGLTRKHRNYVRDVIVFRVQSWNDSLQQNAKEIILSALKATSIYIDFGAKLIRMMEMVSFIQYKFKSRIWFKIAKTIMLRRYWQKCLLWLMNKGISSGDNQIK